MSRGGEEVATGGKLMEEIVYMKVYRGVHQASVIFQQSKSLENFIPHYSGTDLMQYYFPAKIHRVSIG